MNNQKAQPHKVIAILWPSFLVAVVATGIFFSLFDPVEIYHTSGSGAELSALGHYTIGFFSFWLLGVINSALVLYFLKPCE
jgi:hypothetical protein